MSKWVAFVLVLSMALCMMGSAAAENLVVVVNENSDGDSPSVEVALGESGNANAPTQAPHRLNNDTTESDTPPDADTSSAVKTEATPEPTKTPPKPAPEYTPKATQKALDATKEPTSGSVVAVMDDEDSSGAPEVERFYAGEPQDDLDDLPDDDLGDSLDDDLDDLPHDSPYFWSVDFYSATSDDQLTILPKFQTIQQSEQWSSGPAAALMVLTYFGKQGDYTEKSLAALRGEQLTGKTKGEEAGTTSLLQMIDIFQGIGGFEMLSTFDLGNPVEEFTLEYIRQVLGAQLPIIVGWNELGGHWQVIIGYDTMGTEEEDDDVIIVADPNDTGDHNQDGYFVYSAERFLKNFTFYDLFVEADGNERCFLIVKPRSA